MGTKKTPVKKTIPKGEIKRADWEAIERDYKDNAKSIREIGKDHDVSDTAIRKKATAEGWVRGNEIRTRANRRAMELEQKKALEPLTPQQARFVSEYLIDLNGKQAAIRAGYSPPSAAEQAARLLTYDGVRKAIDIGMANRLVRVEIDQDAIVRELINVVRADPNELVEFQRTCCRHCYGIDFKFQRTRSEMESDRAEYQIEVEKNEAAPPDRKKNMRPFNERGGIGYDARLPPNEKCEECFGKGVGQAFFKDTRNLSAEGRALYAGVKQTKDGYEIKMHDKHAFIQLLMRHAGMLSDKLKANDPVENAMAKLLEQIQGTPLRPKAADQS